MDPTQIYIAMRSEIVANHVLMHWFTISVALAMLTGVVIVERLGNTILSVFLPLLSLSWSATVLRFDFFIHRQAAYLRVLESQAQSASPMWETWKGNLQSTGFVVPIADLIAVAVIVVPTLYLLFGPAQQYFVTRSWRGHKIYSFSVSAIMTILLLSLTVVPRLATR